MTEQRRRVYDMLLKLPAVFDLRDVMVYLGIDRNYAKKFCARVCDRSMAAPLGPRAAVYFNLAIDPNGPKNRLKEAVDKRLYVPVIAIGAFALHQHGWTTQRPHGREIAWPDGGPMRTIPDMNGIDFHARKQRWFQTVLAVSEPGIDGFLTAPPEYALVDAIMSNGKGGLWMPDPDDIDPTSEIDGEEAIAAIRRAAVALRADTTQVEEYIARIPALEDSLPTP